MLSLQRSLPALICLAGLGLGLWAEAALPAPVPLRSVAPAQPGAFPAAWVNGSDCGNEAQIQVHAYNPDLFILRQSPCLDFEAPFLFLLFGTEKALLLDTGSAPSANLEPVVSQLIDDWLIQNGLPDLHLVVGHTHAHGDHIRNDDEFANRPNTTLVSLNFAAMTSFWGFQNWPLDQVTFDLGGRVLDVLATPGHSGDALTFYDRETELLLTGDTLYPGRLYIFGAQLSGQWDVFRDSIQRLATFASNNPVCWILGCHIEMTDKPGRDFAYGTEYHPSEHVLELDPALLFDLNQALINAPTARTIVFDDFIVAPTF